MVRIYTLLCLSFYLLSCNAQKAPTLKTSSDNNTLLWEVSGNGLSKPSYLFGTFHLMCKGDIRFSEQLQKAVKSSDKVYMELKIDDPAVLLGGLMYMTMQNDTTLKDLYTPAEYTRIENYFKDSLQTPLGLLQKMKPEMLVALLYPKMMDCSSPASIEEEIGKLAKANKKEIIGLETVQFQASVFDSIPYKVQAKELMKNIDSFETYKKEFSTMLALYKKQKLDNLSEVDNDNETAAYDEILVNRRNRNWVSQLKLLMKNNSLFIAVGAGHLPGPQGLIELLRKQGYKVVGIMN